MDINEVIANNLIRIRQEKNLSVSKLAVLSGVSKGILSQIENQTTNPTINTIWKISSGLNVPYTELMSDNSDFAKVITEDHTLFQSSDDGSYRIFGYFQTNIRRDFELFRVELDAGKKHDSVGHSTTRAGSKAEEYILVVQGELTLIVDGETFVVKRNEAISFDATTEHLYDSTGEDMLVMTMINYY